MTSQEFSCKWVDCARHFNNYEELLRHLSHQHIGKKATGTLTTHCLWENCGVMTTKRDHLMSHLKVHLPIKPFKCSLCHKAFKRSYDLKKHERIHTEEHQASLPSNQPGFKPAKRHKRKTQDSSQTGSRSESIDENTSSREQQDIYDPLYQNIIPQINQIPLLFVPEDPNAIYNSLIVSPEPLENPNDTSLYPTVPTNDHIPLEQQQQEFTSIYPTISSAPSSFDTELRSWCTTNHRRSDSLPILNYYPLSTRPTPTTRTSDLKRTFTVDNMHSVTFEERRHLVHLANVFQAPNGVTTASNKEITVDELWKSFSNVSLKQHK